jgi:ferric-chelate reductase
MRHQGSIFKPAQAALTLFPDIGTNDIVVRIDFQHQHRPWKAGQHFFVCFPELSIWQSHPFTTASLPQSGPTQEHTYIVRCRNGQTANLAKLAATTSSTPVILTGPYGGLRGEALMRAPPSRRNLLAIAGGTGISFALPLVLRALSKDSSHSISLVWIIRRGSHLSWFKAEISRLQALAEAANTTFCIQIFVTREAQPHTSSTSSLEEPKHKSEPGQLDGLGSEKELGKETFVQAVTGLDLSHGGRTSKLPITYLASHHPSMDNVLTTFLEKLEGTDNARTPTVVAGSGPSGLGHDIRATVARINDPEKVWRGDGAVVECVWDDRGW